MVLNKQPGRVRSGAKFLPGTVLKFKRIFVAIKKIRAGNRDSCRSPRELQRKIVKIKLARVATARSLNKQPHLLTHKLFCRSLF